MKIALHLNGRALPCAARRGGRDLLVAAMHAPMATPLRGCQLECGASTRPSVRQRLGHLTRRIGRRGAVACHAAAAKNFYEILGVTQSASDRDVKSAYRKLAMKLHPDVNKAPDAQKRFMEVKVAYETLSDAKQRAEYDRRLRVGYGGFSGGGSRSGGGYSSSSGRAGGSYGGGGSWGPNLNQEPIPGLDDLIRELEREFTAWANEQRAKGPREKSLIEELEGLGGELLDFLEESLGIKDEPKAGAGSSGRPGSSSQQQQQPGGAAREPRSAAERFDAFWQQYGDGAAGAASSRGGSSSSSGNAVGGSPGSGSARQTSSSQKTVSTGSTPHSSGPARSTDDEIEAQLQALKKKLNKL